MTTAVATGLLIAAGLAGAVPAQARALKEPVRVEAVEIALGKGVARP